MPGIPSRISTQSPLATRQCHPAPKRSSWPTKWYEASKSVDKEIQGQVQARATFWYKQALGELSGFTKTRVEKLVEEIDVAKPDLARP